MEKKLFLLDAYALIYRGYYALLRSPRYTSAGLNTSAIFGFVNTLEDVLKKENPGYIAVCFDPAHGKTFRHDKYPEYKAGRDKQPEDITLSIPYIKDILRAMRIPVVEMEGYEADDIIGTIARKAEADGFVTYMMTLDKDYGQLVSDKVFMYRPAIKGQGFEVRGPEQVCGKYGISRPAQVIDLLALEGDASDNVPGCPGVGEKTAAKLIAEYGSVENLLDSSSSLKGALKTKIEDNAEQIRMSKWLVTICTDVPVTVTPDDFRRREPDTDTLIGIYRELEFKGLISKLTMTPGTLPPSPPVVAASLFDFDNSAAAVEESIDTEMTDSAADAAALVRRAVAAAQVGISLDAAGDEAMTARISGIALAFNDKDSETPVTGYIPLPQQGYEELAVALEPLFADASVTLISDGIKRIMVALRRRGITFEGARWFDTTVAHYLCNPEGKHDIATLAENYLGIKAAIASTAADYAQRASIALRLRQPLIQEVDEKGQTKLLEDVELPLIEVLAAMEWTGVRIDPAELRKLSKEIGARAAALEEKAFEIAGGPFNVGSPSQVGHILFDVMAIDPKAKKTKGGAWSTAETELEKYAADVPLVRYILDIRALRKLLATYIDALPKLVNPRTGKIHTTFNQTVTATGRISSSNPNLQNIPVRSADGRDIRRAFIADPGDLILSADYSQIELRLMADFSKDPDMVGAFISGTDIHRATAAKIYHINPEDVSDNQRRNAKTANFGIIYGISAFGLSQRLGISRGEAKELIDGYFEAYPHIRQYISSAIETARASGYVSTILGRRRYLPDISSRSNTVRGYAERNAVNAPLQGSAADIIKVAMIDIYRRMEAAGMRSRMIMQVHDELIFNVVPDEAAAMQALVTDAMEKAYRSTVPMEVSSGLAGNWLDAH